MSTKRIREAIAQAVISEHQTKHLEKLLCLQIDKLHSAIELPEEDTIDILKDFVIKYIEHVPDMLDAVEGVTTEAGLSSYSQPFIELAKEYFLKPPELISNHSGLDELMAEAYLAHRLIEEINDRFIPKAGIPLVPIDMTCSNLIIHHVIGEPFSNELDDAVHVTAETLMKRESIFDSEPFQRYAERHKKAGWSDVEKKWPCLTDDAAINLSLRV